MIEVAILVTILCPAVNDADFSHIEPKVVIQQGQAFMMCVAEGQPGRGGEGTTYTRFLCKTGSLDGSEIGVVVTYSGILVPDSLHVNWMLRKDEFFAGGLFRSDSVVGNTPTIGHKASLQEYPAASKEVAPLFTSEDYRSPSQREYDASRKGVANAIRPLYFLITKQSYIKSLSELPHNFWVNAIGEVHYYLIYKSQIHVFRSYGFGYTHLRSFPSPFFGDFELVEQDDYMYFITVSSGAYRVPLAKVRLTKEEESQLRQDDRTRSPKAFLQPDNPYFEDLQMEKVLATEDLDVRVILEDQDRDWLGVITPTTIYNLEDPGNPIEIPKKISKQIAHPDATPINIVRALYPIIHPDAGYTPAENLLPQAGLTGQIKQHPIIWAAAIVVALAILYAATRKRRAPHNQD